MNFTPGSGKWRPFGDAASLPQKAVASLFDDYATTFDESLDSLGYRVPGLIASKLKALRPTDCVGRSKGSRGWVVADVGCGTGKVGTALRAQKVPLAAPLLGCDLSPRILKECRCRVGKLYGILACKDASLFLNELASTTASVRRARKAKGRCSENRLTASDRTLCSTKIGASKTVSVNSRATLQAPKRAEGSGSIDTARCPKWVTAIIAADVLVYIGECTAFFKAAAKCLPKGGILIFSVESLERAVVAYAVEAKNSVATSALKSEKSVSNNDDDDGVTLCCSSDSPEDAQDVRHLLSKGYRLLPSDRFAYTKAYIRNISQACGFETLETEDTWLRMEGCHSGMRQVEGRVYVMRWQGRQNACRPQEDSNQCNTEPKK